MTYVPIQTRIRTALLALFAEKVNPELQRCGMLPLAATAFKPLPPGDVMEDTLAVAYLGAIRANNDRDGLRLTRATRDNLFGYVCEIWCFGPDDAQAQADRVQGRQGRVGVDQPFVIGNTEALSAEDETRESMLWHLALPLSCRVRTTRPEQQS